MHQKSHRKILENNINNGVLVKYHPCNIHARGSPCQIFNLSHETCNRAPLTCEEPDYDKWFREVLKGKIKCFYPNKIKLLESLQIPLFLLHVHYRAIIGEVKIERTSEKNGDYFYWFEEFLKYPYHVQPELLRTDPRLQKSLKRGRWKHIYISRETVEEIRSLSNLAEKDRRKLGKDVEDIIEALKKNTIKRSRQIQKWESLINKEFNELENKYGIPESIINQTKMLLSEVMKKKSFYYSKRELFYVSLYIANRILKKPVLLTDISQVSGIPKKKLSLIYRILVRSLKLSVPSQNINDLIESHGMKLGLTSTSRCRALEILEEVKAKVTPQGKSPATLAALAIFLMCQEKKLTITQKKIVEVFGISRVTLRRYINELK